MNSSNERKRLQEHKEKKTNWKNWGPYLSERAWGTVREDYSPQGDVWDYFTHDHARSRAYRWGEDGIGGISDRRQFICFAVALWNGKDPILKERFFGLTGSEGNHGEDVKEYYFYLDNTPTHSYMKMLYKYPQAEYPYLDLIDENRRRSYDDYEYELLDTGIFEDDRYFDITIEYAKADQDDILIQITLTNRGPEAAPCTTLPTLWFRNTWSWGYENGPMDDVTGKPILKQIADDAAVTTVAIEHPTIGTYFLYAENADQLLFTENETNTFRFGNATSENRYFKDAFHRYLILDEIEAVNQEKTGTKVAALYTGDIEPDQAHTIHLRLSNIPHQDPFAEFDTLFCKRQAEADEFYRQMQREDLSEDELRVQRQAFAGMLWAKQFYYYNMEQWLRGDPGYPPPPDSRLKGRNSDWGHLYNFDIVSMPDKWEYPWYASWDLAFHCLPLALVDPDFAKRQLDLMAREWYMHPNGALPAYEWKFGDANPPVHAWAAWRVYKIEARHHGTADRNFLESIFHKLLLNFTWWVNRKDTDGNNVFQGGFLGLDNISVFDRSAPLPTGGHIDQSDGTAWMGFYSLIMLKIALEPGKR